MPRVFLPGHSWCRSQAGHTGGQPLLQPRDEGSQGLEPPPRAATGGRDPAHWGSTCLQYSPFCGRWRCTWQGSCQSSHPSPKESPEAAESQPPSRLRCSLKHRHSETVSTGAGVQVGGDWPIQSQHDSGYRQGTHRCRARAACQPPCLRVPRESFLCPASGGFWASQEPLQGYWKNPHEGTFVTQRQPR